MHALRFNRKVEFMNLKRLNEQHQNELSNAMSSLLLSGDYLKGKAKLKFEKDFASFIGTKYCNGVGSGMDALRLILRAYRIMGKMKKGDRILVPQNAFYADVMAIIEEGFEPILVSPDPDTFGIDSTAIADYLDDRISAVLAVHLFGLPAIDLQLIAFAKANELLIIEDNTHAVGATFMDTKTGNIGDASFVSFYPTNSLGALGDGGAILTNDEILSEIVGYLSSSCKADQLTHKYRGIDSELDEIQAAVLSVKLKYMEAHNHFRGVIANAYLTGIKSPFIALPLVPDHCEHIWHSFVIRTPYRDALSQYLKQNHIETRIYHPMSISRQSAFEELSDQFCPRNEKLQDEMLCLPMSPFMFLEDVEYVVHFLNAFRPKFDV